MVVFLSCSCQALFIHTLSLCLSFLLIFQNPGEKQEEREDLLKLFTDRSLSCTCCRPIAWANGKMLALCRCTHTRRHTHTHTRRHTHTHTRRHTHTHRHTPIIPSFSCSLYLPLFSCPFPVLCFFSSFISLPPLLVVTCSLLSLSLSVSAL